MSIQDFVQVHDLAFVDDANELTGLHFVLDFLCKTADQKKSVKKLIVTVRDYARQQVISQILEVKKPRYTFIHSNTTIFLITTLHQLFARNKIFCKFIY